MALVSKLKNIVRWARITAAGVTSRQFWTQQVEYKGKAGDCLLVFPYGIHANVPVDALVLMFSVEGDADNRAGIAWTPKTRPDLTPGEVALYNPITGAIVKMNIDGGIDVQAEAPITFTGPKVTFNTDDFEVNAANIIMNGSASYTLTTVAYSLSVTTGQATSSGGGIDFAGGISSNGKSIDENHAHTGVTPGAGTSGPVA